jgi:hypothetical protein
VLPDQWHRALLRAQLRELGYDALGAPDLAGGLLYPALEPERGPVGLIVVDHGALTPSGETLLPELLARHEAPAMLIAPAGVSPPAGPWVRVLNRPVSIAEITRVVQELLPTTDAHRTIQ